MGLFNSYLKEGPGVSKNAPKKKGIFLFFEVLYRKFFKLVKANVIYVLESIPFLAIGIFAVAPFVANALGMKAAVEAGTNHGDLFLLYISITCALLNIFGSGPASAAYAYVTRCFTRSYHVWVWSDGWNNIKENFKQSMIMVILDVAVLIIAVYSIYFYGTFAVSVMPGGQTMFILFRYILSVMLCLYMLMHIFIYQIMVTYECSFRELLKNSFIMMMAKLPMCLLLAAVTGIIFVLMFIYIGNAGIFVYILIGLSLTRFPLEFYAARVIEKNIKTVEKKEKRKKTADGDHKTTVVEGTEV